MYSVVLMAALTTTTADAPSFGFLRGCHGGWGARAGCYGCNGCNGCYGGGWGCHGGGGWGCHGGGWGCHGGLRSYGCHGCYGGGCYGGGCHGGYVGCYGGGCHGGCNGYACSGGGHGCQGCTGGKPAAKPEPLMKPAEDKTPKKQTSSGTGAKIIVDLPADAKLFIDDRPVKSTSQHPIFATPQLEEGKTYYYEMRVEVVRDGQVATNTKRVIFHAGDEVRESFAQLAPVTAEKVAADTQK